MFKFIFNHLEVVFFCFQGGYRKNFVSLSFELVSLQ